MAWKFIDSSAQRASPDWSGSKFPAILLGALVWGYAFVNILSFIGSPVIEFDDAIPLVHGVLVQQGRVPNLDFYSFYPPLGLYAQAAMFRLFGQSIVSSRLIGAFFYLLVLFLTNKLLRARFPGWGSLVPLAVLVVSVSIGAALDLASWPGFALSLIALLSYLLAQDQASNRLLAIALSGLLTAAAILYRINFGGYVAIVVTLDLLLRWWLGEARWSRERLRSLSESLVAFALPLVVGCVGVCLWVYGSNAGRAVSEFVVTASKVMMLRGFITLHFTAESTCFVMLPSAWFFFRILRGREILPREVFFAAALAAANLLIVRAYTDRPAVALIGLAVQLGSVLFLHLYARRLELPELSLLLYYCCLLHYYLGRADWWHSRWLLVAAALLAPFLLFQERKKGIGQESEALAPKGTAFAVLIALITIFTAAADIRPRSSWARNGARLIVLRLRHPQMPDSDLVLGTNPVAPGWSSVYFDYDEQAALRYIRARNRQGPIFVGVGDHSRVYFSDLRAYWLAGLPIGVRNFQLETRVATEAPVQKEIISDLERNRVRWLMLDRNPFPGDETFEQQAYQGSTLLDEYIRDHFQEEARFGGRYAVLSRMEEGTSIGQANTIP